MDHELMFDKETIWNVKFFDSIIQCTVESQINTENASWFRMRTVQDPNIYIEVPFDYVGSGKRYKK